MISTDNQAAVAPAGSEGSKFARWIVVAVLCALLLAACILGYLGWTSTDTKVPEAGFVALVLGVVFSLVIGAGLMALVFYSSRKGYDEPVVLIPEPVSDPEDERDAQR
ncbi:hypothetical protein [Bradyrhizobium guangzhouense]|uniref:Uncharacterized protein n=1 Tax=Bradyrhizobium guangzhouense TaxID=1325095 RepID=A0AAE6C7A3_9BRAD|nr:hypothetical protein [Bradyrhizobium guangzhouense]QAU45236.1 hypothetical protein XH91_07650 [Bradyrhizobium guangzhouense]RXH12374.1 hypothetical protein EAS56_17880 [Bradyrhizobium guangzhouense]